MRGSRLHTRMPMRTHIGSHPLGPPRLPSPRIIGMYLVGLKVVFLGPMIAVGDNLVVGPIGSS